MKKIDRWEELETADRERSNQKVRRKNTIENGINIQDNNNKNAI